MSDYLIVSGSEDAVCGNPQAVCGSVDPGVTLNRLALDTMLPPGSIWKYKEGGDLDLFLDGVAANNEETMNFLSELANLRNAQKTTILKDLLREYGLEENSALTEQEERDRLQSVQTESHNTGSSSYLQTKLQESGFNVLVHLNEPAVDPDLFLFDTYLTICDDDVSVCENSESVCDNLLDDLIINGNIYITDIGLIPDESGYWNNINFVGGPATRNATTGALETIERVELPVERRDELRRLITKYKPMHSWIGLVAKFI